MSDLEVVGMVILAVLVCIPALRGQYTFWHERLENDLVKKQQTRQDLGEKEYIRQLSPLTLDLLCELLEMGKPSARSFEVCLITSDWHDDASVWLIRHNRLEEARRYLEAKARFLRAVSHREAPPPYTQELLGGLLAEYAAEARKMAASAMHRATRGKSPGH